MLFVSLFSKTLLASMTMTVFVSLAMPCINIPEKRVRMLTKFVTHPIFGKYPVVANFFFSC